MPALSELLAVAAACTAAALDLRSRRIPNWLTAGTALGGLGLQLAQPLFAAGAQTSSSIVSALGGGALLLLGFGLCSALGLLGWGDAKLLGAVGVCVRLDLALRVAPCVVVSGGALALLVALRRGQLGEVARALLRLRTLTGRRVDGARTELHLFPFASAIALGTTWAVAGRYLPGIAPW